MNDADRKVAAFVIKRHKARFGSRGEVSGSKENEYFMTAGHLARCPDTTVVTLEPPADGYCAEGTCGLVFIDYELACCHGYTGEYDFHDPMELPELLAMIEEETA